MRERIRAPELDRAVTWLNTDRPLRLDGDLRGRLVLLDFWTYCCVNCIHILPRLTELDRLYKNSLVIIGVHSPKFTAERDADPLRHAVLRNNIEHAVASDPDRQIWSAYAVRAWPTLILIDDAGYIVHRASGEGSVTEMEGRISEEIVAARARGGLVETPLIVGHAAVAKSSDLKFPGKTLADLDSQRLFIADSGNHRIVVASLDGQVRLVIGDGTQGLVDGTAAAARFTNPQGMALAGDTLYVADSGNHAIRAIDLAQGTVTTLCGSGAQATELNVPGQGQHVSLNSPWDLAVMELLGNDGENDRFLFIAMAGSHQVWVLDLRTGGAFPYAGNGQENIRDGLRPDSSFAQPSGIAFDGQRLFVADSEVSALRCIDLSAEEVTTIAGHGLFVFGDLDGDWDGALLQHPLGVDVAGPEVWVADTYNHKIKVVSLVDQTIQTVSGDGQAGFRDGRPARFFEPSGVSVAGAFLYVADTNNHAIRLVERSTGEVQTLSLRGLTHSGSHTLECASKSPHPGPGSRCATVFGSSRSGL